MRVLPPIRTDSISVYHSSSAFLPSLIRGGAVEERGINLDSLKNLNVGEVNCIIASETGRKWFVKIRRETPMSSFPAFKKTAFSSFLVAFSSAIQCVHTHNNVFAVYQTPGGNGQWILPHNRYLQLWMYVKGVLPFWSGAYSNRFLVVPDPKDAYVGEVNCIIAFSMTKLSSGVPGKDGARTFLFIVKERQIRQVGLRNI